MTKDKFGGVLVDEPIKDKFGGIAVDQGQAPQDIPARQPLISPHTIEGLKGAVFQGPYSAVEDERDLIPVLPKEFGGFDPTALEAQYGPKQIVRNLPLSEPISGIKVQPAFEPNLELKYKPPTARQKMFEDVTGGITESMVGTLDMLESPFGLALLFSPAATRALGVEKIAAPLQKALVAYFTYKMGKAVPEIATKLGEEFGKPPEKRDDKLISKLVTDAVTDTGFTVLGAMDVVSPLLKTKLDLQQKPELIRAGPLTLGVEAKPAAPGYEVTGTGEPTARPFVPPIVPPSLTAREQEKQLLPKSEQVAPWTYQGTWGDQLRVRPGALPDPRTMAGQFPAVNVQMTSPPIAPGAVLQGPNVPMVPGPMGQPIRGDMGPPVTAEQRWQGLGFGPRTRLEAAPIERPKPADGIPLEAEERPVQAAKKILKELGWDESQINRLKPAQIVQAAEAKQPPPDDEGGVAVPKEPTPPVKPPPGVTAGIPRELIEETPAEAKTRQEAEMAAAKTKEEQAAIEAAAKISGADPRMEVRKQRLLREIAAIDDRLSKREELENRVIDRNLAVSEETPPITVNDLIRNYERSKAEKLAEIEEITARQQRITKEKTKTQERREKRQIVEAEAQAAKPTKPPTAGPAGFVTSTGSQYMIDELGHTTRLKKSPGVGQGITHQPHATVFLSEEAANAIKEAGKKGGRVVLADRQPDGSFLQVRPRIKQDDIRGIENPYVVMSDRQTGRIMVAVKASHTPEVGKHPFEIIYEGQKKTHHLGNVITEVRTRPSGEPPTPKREGMENLPPRLQSEFANAEKALKEDDLAEARTILFFIREEAARIAKDPTLTDARKKLLDAINVVLDQYDAELQTRETTKYGELPLTSQKGKLPEEILNYHYNEGPGTYQRRAGVQYLPKGLKPFTLMEHAENLVRELESVFTSSDRRTPTERFKQLTQRNQEALAAAIRMTEWMRKTQMTKPQRDQINLWLDETIGPERKHLTPEEQNRIAKLREKRDTIPKGVKKFEKERKTKSTKESIDDYVKSYFGKPQWELAASQGKTLQDFIKDQAEKYIEQALRHEPKDPSRWFDDLWKTRPADYIASILKETGMADKMKMSDWQRQKIKEWMDFNLPKPKTERPPPVTGEVPREAVPQPATREGPAKPGGAQPPPESPAISEATPTVEKGQEKLSREENRAKYIARVTKELTPEIEREVKAAGANWRDAVRKIAKREKFPFVQFGSLNRDQAIARLAKAKATRMRDKIEGSVLLPGGGKPPERPPVPPTTLKSLTIRDPKKDFYAIAQKMREWRHLMGFTEEVVPGIGTTWRKAVQRGRDLLSANPNAANEAVQKFADTRAIDSDMISVVRAKAEQMFAQARNIELARGRGSPDWKPAYDAAVEWDEASKPMQTEWHRAGEAQQGATDIDTGSFTDLSRLFKEITYKEETGKWKEMTERQKEKAEKVAKGVRKAREDAAQAEKQIKEDLQKLDEEEAKAEAEKKKKELYHEPPSDVIRITREDMAREEAERKKRAEEETGLTPRAVRKRARELIDLGGADVDDIRKKIADELGVSISKVTEMLMPGKAGKKMLMQRWKKLTEMKKVEEAAKRWIEDETTPWYSLLIRKIPRAFFTAKILGHGAVGMITHAGVNMFNPHVWAFKNEAGQWKGYWPSFIDQWRYMINRGYHGNMMADLRLDKNYYVARRAGLANDPFHYFDDYQLMQLEDIKLTRRFSKGLKAFIDMGQRGFDALKTFRQVRFNQIWDAIPDSKKLVEVETKAGIIHEPNMQMAKMVADAVNKATGFSAANMGIFTDAANLSLFAPRLELSRWAWLIGDPVKAVNYGHKWIRGEATPSEKQYVMHQFKEKGAIAGTYIGLLVLNQALLNWAGSKQKINAPVLDPEWNARRGDFMAFKAFGKEARIISPLIGIVRLLSQMYHVLRTGRTPYERLTPRAEQEARLLERHARGKLSPFMSTVSDVVFATDFSERPLPWSDEPPTRAQLRRGQTQYEWSEYITQQISPIPIEEAIREVWLRQGMPPEHANRWLQGLLDFGQFAAGWTGARVGTDIYMEEELSGNQGLKMQTLKPIQALKPLQPIKTR